MFWSDCRDKFYTHASSHKIIIPVNPVNKTIISSLSGWVNLGICQYDNELDFLQPSSTHIWRKVKANRMHLTTVRSATGEGQLVKTVLLIKAEVYNTVYVYTPSCVKNVKGSEVSVNTFFYLL